MFLCSGDWVGAGGAVGVWSCTPTVPVPPLMCVPVPICALQFCQAKHKDVTVAVLHELYNYLSVQAGECQHPPALLSLQELPPPAPAPSCPTLEGFVEQAVPFEEF